MLAIGRRGPTPLYPQHPTLGCEPAGDVLELGAGEAEEHAQLLAEVSASARSEASFESFGASAPEGSPQFMGVRSQQATLATNRWPKPPKASNRL